LALHLKDDRAEEKRLKEERKRKRGGGRGANRDNKILFAERNPLPAKNSSGSSPSCARRTSSERKSFASMKSEQAGK